MTRADPENEAILFSFPKGCGNSPKSKMIQALIAETAIKDTEYLLKHSVDEVCWDIVNRTQIQGKDHITAYIQNSLNHHITELELTIIITHGKYASANGHFKLENNDHYSFCHIFDFVSAGKNIIKKITSYIIKMQ